jgi:hypothetical protein
MTCPSGYSAEAVSIKSKNQTFNLWACVQS